LQSIDVAVAVYKAGSYHGDERPAPAPGLQNGGRDPRTRTLTSITQPSWSNARGRCQTDRVSPTPANRAPKAFSSTDPAPRTHTSTTAPATAGDGDTRDTPASGASGLSPREVRRLQRIKVGREQILDAAEELFGRFGYRGTSLQQVAKRCEFSIGALYLFIESKEELLRGVLERRVVTLLSEMRQCVASEGPAHEVLVQLARTLVAFHRRYPDFGRLATMIISGGSEATPGFAEDVTESYQHTIDIEAELFARGQADGSMCTGDPRSLARLFSAMIATYHSLDPVVSPGGAGHLTDDDFIDCVSRSFASGNQTTTPDIR
jgi:AcrR family transcriptional regulator